MHNYEIHHNGKEYTRISKAQAKQLHSILVPVYMDGCKMMPFNMFGTTHELTGYNDLIAQGGSFETYVQSFTYYNCSYEQGYYPAFYTEVK